MADPVGTLRANNIADPTRHRDAFNSRCATRDRERQVGTAYGFGVFVDNAFAGEINLNNVVRGAFQCGVVGYWIDQRHAGNRYIAEGVAVLVQVRVRGAAPAPPGDLHRAAQHQQPTGDGGAGHPRGGHRPALPGDQRRVGGPRALRDHRRGMAGAPRRVRRRVGRDRGSERLRAGYLLTALVTARRKACAFALRMLVRRFHIFIFQ